MTLKERLLNQLKSTNLPPVLMESFASQSEEWFSSLATSVDASPYSFQAWVDAFAVFHSWNNEKRLPTDLERQREYLVCCIEGAGDSSGTLPLQDLLAYYLKSHGVRLVD